MKASRLLYWFGLTVLLGCTAEEDERSATARAERTQRATAIEPVATAPATAPDVTLLLFSRLREGRAANELMVSFGTAQRRFTAAYAQSPSAFVSLGTVLTGRYASALPLCDLTLKGRDDPSARPWCAALPKAVPTLPEVFALYGYQTTLITSDQVGAEQFAPLFDTHINLQSRSDTTTTLQIEQALSPKAEPRPPQLTVVVLGDLNDEPEAADYSHRTAALGARMAPLIAHTPGARRKFAIVGGINGINLGEPSGFSGRAVSPGAQDLLLNRTVHVPLATFDSADESPTQRVTHPVELIDIFFTVARQALIPPPARASDEDLLLPAESHGNHGPTAYMEYGDMLAIRRGPMLLTFRAFFHHGAALDPAVTEALMEEEFSPGKFGLHDVVKNPMQNGNRLGVNKQTAKQMRRHLKRIRLGEAAPGAGVLSTKRLWDLRMTETKGYW
jgi:hypothetical protein